MRKIAKVDGNQAAIVAALRKAGATVVSLAPIGNGVPDLLVGFAGENILMEVKTPKGKHTPDQVHFYRCWRGQEIVTTRDPMDAIKICEELAYGIT